MTHFLSSRNRMGAALALLTLVLSTSAAFGQRRGTFLEPRRAGAFEMGGTSLLSLNAEGNLMVDAGLEVTVLGRAAGPLHSGVRLGVGLLDRTRSLAGTEAGTTERRRTLLPEASGVLRLDPFRGGFRPFAEAELGMSATLIDIRTFDEAGDRTDYAVPAFDPTLHYGWATGARFRLGGGAFLAVRYGERFGGHLDVPDPIQETGTLTTLQPQRRVIGMGLSLAL
jgi:hypothetical protein